MVTARLKCVDRIGVNRRWNCWKQDIYIYIFAANVHAGKNYKLKLVVYPHY